MSDIWDRFPFQTYVSFHRTRVLSDVDLSKLREEKNWKFTIIETEEESSD